MIEIEDKIVKEIGNLEMAMSLCTGSLTSIKEDGLEYQEDETMPTNEEHLVNCIHVMEVNMIAILTLLLRLKYAKRKLAHVQSTPA